MNPTSGRTLAVLGVPGATRRENGTWLVSSFGLVVSELASRWKRIILSVPQLPAETREADFRLPDNVDFVPLPAMTTAGDGFRRRKEIARIYSTVIAEADGVFVRGVLIPAVPEITRAAAARDVPVVHWLVGNPMALLRSHRRAGPLQDTLGKLFVWNWERQLRAGARRGHVTLLCNGSEIAARYRQVRTRVTVSTTIRAQDLRRDREDTCDRDTINILTVAYVRPEKGIEYLLRALPLLARGDRVRLVLAGSRGRYPAYQARLDELLAEHGMSDRVTWAGHVVGPELENHYRQADIFVLPTLSEGTPRVLLEAMAHGVPVVASEVGGIPDSVTSGENGLLVPPKDPAALARTLDRLIEDRDLRRGLIQAGYRFVAEHTLDRFVDIIQTELTNGE